MSYNISKFKKVLLLLYSCVNALNPPIIVIIHTQIVIKNSTLLLKIVEKNIMYKIKRDMFVKIVERSDIIYYYRIFYSTIYL